MGEDKAFCSDIGLSASLCVMSSYGRYYRGNSESQRWFGESILRLVWCGTYFFLGSNDLFRPVIWVTDTWKEFGYATIIYLAALAGVNDVLYEAASLDDAGYIKKTWHITLPGIRPTIILMMTLKMGSILNAGFDQIYNLYSSITMESGFMREIRTIPVLLCSAFQI